MLSSMAPSSLSLKLLFLKEQIKDIIIGTVPRVLMRRNASPFSARRLWRAQLGSSPRRRPTRRRDDVDVFYLFLQKQNIALSYIPLWSTRQSTERSTGELLSEPIYTTTIPRLSSATRKPPSLSSTPLSPPSGAGLTAVSTTR
jgi:hypothetical protein